MGHLRFLCVLPLVLVAAECLQEHHGGSGPAPAAPPPESITIIKRRIWKEVPPETMFRAIIQGQVGQGRVILNQSKADGIINTDWHEEWSGGSHSRSRLSFVISKTQEATMVQVNIKYQRKKDGWIEIPESVVPSAFARMYRQTFDWISQKVGKPFVGQ